MTIMKKIIDLLAQLWLFSLGILAYRDCQHKCLEEKSCNVAGNTYVCYYIFLNGKRTWKESEELCNEEMLTMIKISKRWLNDSNIQEDLMKNLYPDVDAWLGGKAQKLGKWTFINNVTIDETNANKLTPMSDGQEMHLCGVVRANGTLDKEDCTQKRFFICQFDQRLDVSTYLISESQKTWFDARELCMGWGGALFSLKKNEYINVRKLKLNSQDLLNETLFIGLIRRRWQWQDGKDIEYFNWAYGEPNKLSNKCIKIKKDGSWNDEDCNERLYTLCEKGGIEKRRIEVSTPPSSNAAYVAVGVIVPVAIIIGVGLCLWKKGKCTKVICKRQNCSIGNCYEPVVPNSCQSPERSSNTDSSSGSSSYKSLENIAAKVEDEKSADQQEEQKNYEAKDAKDDDPEQASDEVDATVENDKSYKQTETEADSSDGTSFKNIVTIHGYK